MHIVYFITFEPQSMKNINRILIPFDLGEDSTKKNN